MNIESSLNQAEPLIGQEAEKNMAEAETVFSKPQVGDFIKIETSGEVEDGWKIIEIEGEDVVAAKKAREGIKTIKVNMAEVLELNS